MPEITQSEFQLPFKIRTGEGWTHYIVHVADIGSNRLLVSGYEQLTGEENILSSYISNLSDGTLELQVKANNMLGYFPETGCAVYEGMVKDENPNSISFFSIYDGLQATLYLDDSMYYTNLIFNPHTNSYYIKQFNEAASEFYVLAINAVTLETQKTLVISKNDFGLITVDNNGCLLIMNHIH